MLAAMDILTSLSLASDAVQLAVTGIGFMLFAGFASLMEWRRNRLRGLERLERVGWVPWTPLFVCCAIIGGGCLAMSLPVVLGRL
ncbi:MAG: hypothetical protein AAGK02_06930 [Pseudomonadota bacterium]